MSANSPIVVFSDDWGRHPSSCQHLFRHLLDKIPVIWVNTIGLRSPRFSVYDLKRAIQVLQSWALRSKAPQPAGSANPTVLSPIMLPSFKSPLASYVNQKLLLRAVHNILTDKREQNKAVLVSTIPIIPQLFSGHYFARTIYYCVDDFTNWSGINGAVMHRLEMETLRHCNMLIATSDELLQSRGKHCSNAHLITHGVNFEHFAKCSILSPPAEIADLPKPVIGFFGVFDERTDGPLLTRIAQHFASGSIAILGPTDRDLSPFASFPNIHFLKPVSYQELPRWVAGFDACILPYRVDESTQSINPLKLREYLATGKPVITTPLPEALRLSAYLRVAAADNFPQTVALEIATPSPRHPALESMLRSESWGNKARDFLRLATANL
jgi:glycosyltransferase involved in cell wall biosynthesis